MEFPEIIRTLEKEQHDFLSYKLGRDDCEIFFSEISKDTFIREHQHDVTTLNFIAEGCIEVFMDGKPTKYEVGQWCTIPRRTLHTLRALTGSRLIEFWFRMQ